MPTVVSFEQAPPLGAPLRFFLTAPIFSALAAVLMLVQGPSLWASRWVPGVLAVTHLMTVGFMLQVMLGALQQLLPIVVGAPIERPLAVARVVHACITAGLLLLVGGFLWGRPWSFAGAAVLLGA